MRIKEKILIESYIKEVISKNEQHNLLIERVLILENSTINENLYKKILKLGNYSKKTALILSMLIATGINSAQAKNNSDNVADALNNNPEIGSIKVSAQDVETASGKISTVIKGLGVKKTGEGGPNLNSSLKKVSGFSYQSKESILEDIGKNLKDLKEKDTIKSVSYAYQISVQKGLHKVNISDDAIERINSLTKRIDTSNISLNVDEDKFVEKYNKFLNLYFNDGANLNLLNYMINTIALYKVCSVMEDDCIKALKKIKKGSTVYSVLISKGASVVTDSGKKRNKGKSDYKVKVNDKSYYEFYTLMINRITTNFHNQSQIENISDLKNLTNSQIYLLNHFLNYEGKIIARNINAFSLRIIKDSINNFVFDQGNTLTTVSGEQGIGNKDAKGKKEIDKLNKEIENIPKEMNNKLNR